MSTNPYQYDPGMQGYGGDNMAAAFADESARAAFIRSTYMHLAGAIMAFVALEALLFTAIPAETMHGLIGRMVGGYSWLIVLGAFMVVSWIARWWAESGQSRGMQYLGLSLYVVGEAIIMLPLLYFAMRIDPHIPAVAGVLTGLVFVGLTAFVFVTRVDLNWMGKYLCVAGLVAMGAIVCAIVFNFSLGGILFSSVMVALAAGYIVYDTSNVLHHYRTDQHVAASLALFASVALLFWYILRLVMAFSSDD